jgi:hypothetical protein
MLLQDSAGACHVRGFGISGEVVEQTRGAVCIAHRVGKDVRGTRGLASGQRQRRVTNGTGHITWPSFR